MLYLSEPVDRERVVEPRGIFFRSQKVQVARSYAPLKLINFFFADDGYSLESRRLNDDDFGLSFEDESDF